MSLLILAVFLAVVQTSPPLPRKAPNDQASQTTKNQNKSDGQQTDSAPPSVHSASPPTTQSNSGTYPTAPSNQEKSISIGKLPAVTVNTDWWSRASVILTGIYVLLTAALVAVGFFGVRYARKSLQAIESQLKEMRSQVAQMEQSGKQTDELIKQATNNAVAAKENADAALLNAQAVINAERAWIFCEICSDSSHGNDWRFTNHGNTPAEIVGLQLERRSLELAATLSDPPHYGHNQLAHPRFIAPNGGFWNHPAIDFIQEISDQERNALSQRKIKLWLYGRITYRDVFQAENALPHETRFCFFYEANSNDFVDAGPGEYTKQT